MRFKPLGDQGVQIIFGHEINIETSRKIQHLLQLLQTEETFPLVEAIPAYTTLSVYYDAMMLTYDECVHELKRFCTGLSIDEQIERTIVEIPTCYGGEFGPDLLDVAQYHQLSINEVIEIHSSISYFIFMLGFSPGFPYLGGMDQRIATPRLSSPRSQVKAGSVGIAGPQTGIYSIDSPGGWRIIGRTPVALYSPLSDHPFLLQAGEYLRFVPIFEDEYVEIEHFVQKGRYEPNRRNV